MTAILYVGFAGVAGFACWQAWVFLQGMRDRGGPVLPAGGNRRAGRAPQRARSQPVGDLANPAADVGLHELAGDPGGIRPPPQARRRDGFWRLAEGYREEIASYEFPGPRDRAGQHYIRTLGEGGFTLLGDRTDDGGRRWLSFVAEETKVVVSLRNAASEAKMVVVAVTVISPAGSRPAARE